MTVPMFVKQADDAVYFITESQRVDGHGYRLGFWPQEPSADLGLPLPQTWMMPGVYLFLDQALPSSGEQARFVEKLQQFLRSSTFRQAQFVWIENPTAALFQWRVAALAVADGQVQRFTQFEFRNYGLAIANQTTLSLSPDQTGFLLTSHHNQPALTVSTDYGAHQLTAISSVALPFTGPAAGCWQFDLSLQRPTDTQADYTELTHLDVGFRMFFKDAGFARSAGDFLITAQRYPMLSEAAADIQHYRRETSDGTSIPADLTLRATLDWLHPLNSQLAFVGADGSRSIIPSGFRSNLGYTIHLRPRNIDSRLVLAQRPSDSRDPTPPYYWVPAGDFEMQVPIYSENPKSDQGTKAEDNLLCGLSGVEYIKLSATHTNLLCFQPGQAAFAPGFTPIHTMTQRLFALISDETGVPKPELDADDLIIPEVSFTHQQQEPTVPLDRSQRMALLETIQAEYFPFDYTIDAAAQADLFNARTLGSLVRWFQQTLRASSQRSRQSDAEALNATATTAWAYVCQAEKTPSIYYAQPDQAILYEASDQPDANNDPRDNLLRYLEVPATALPAPGVRPSTFPLLPYGNVRSSLVDFLDLEQQVVSPLRRAKISAITADHGHLPLVSTPSNKRSTGTTPQGLLAEYSPDFNTIESLLLALDTHDTPLKFSNIERTSPLRAALQSNQLFLVITNPLTLKPYFDDNNRLTIQDWTFDLDPDQWRRDTVLIFKFYDQSLVELLGDMGVWAQPDEFNSNKTGTQAQLLNYFQSVLLNNDPSQSVKERQNYANLIRAAQLPNWSGILALNVDVPPSALPDQLKALAAGINEEKFYAQYVGIETTPIVPRNNQLIPGQSSLFGLIDYQDDSTPTPNDSGYNFQVTSLRVLFQNSQIKAFSAEVIVTLDKLFDEPTQLVDSPSGRNTLLLKGTAENHDGDVTYAFNFSGNNQFSLPDSTTLNDVEIVKAQFSTDPLGPSPQDTVDVTGRFIFWGRLNFEALPQLDLFSFGTDTSDALTDVGQTEAKYLSFSNLAVTMTFEQVNDDANLTDEQVDALTQTLSPPVFAFIPHNMAFDLKRSGVRENSLFAKFPLKLTGMLYSQGEKTTDDYGFMPVSSPLPQRDLAPTWYGFTFDLELGTLGALAGGAGLVATMVTAWSPSLQPGNNNTENNNDDDPIDGGGIFVGLRLPGSTGGKREITIQNLLKISFKRIELSVGNTNGRTSYLLKLKNIVLKFMILSLPPSARSEIIIFGNPDGSITDRSVGWYAAYAKEP